MFEIIKKICDFCRVAGCEKDLLSYIVDLCKDYCDDYYYDNFGNLILHKKGKGEKILVNTNVTNIGMFVSSVEDDKIKFKTMGRIDPKLFVGLKVRDIKGKNIGYIFKENPSDDEKVTLSDIYTECSSKIKVEEGDIIEPFSELTKINEKMYGIGVASASMIYAAMKMIKENYDNDIYFAFTILDNLGFKGAKVAAKEINPSKAYILSYSSYPYKDSKISMGKGAVVRIKDNFITVLPKVFKEIISELSLNKIPYQLEISEEGGNYSGGIMYLTGGIPTAIINVPSLSSGNLIEAINEEDVENIIKSLKVLLVSN